MPALKIQSILQPKNKDGRKKSTEHGIVLKENGDFSSVVGQFLFLSKCPEPYPTMTILQAELFFQTNTPWMVNLVNHFKKSMLIPCSVSIVQEVMVSCSVLGEICCYFAKSRTAAHLGA